MVVAELEVFHSRAIAPTRRVALGEHRLPVDSTPASGPILLAAVVAATVGSISDDLRPDLDRLMSDIEVGRRIAQPRLRHRFQADRIGLQRSTHRLVARGARLHLDLDDRGAPIQQALAAIYAVGTLGVAHRRAAMDVVRRGARWDGPLDDRLIHHLMGSAGSGWVAVDGDPVMWALGVFGLDEIDRAQVQRRFRQLLRDAHPDHGGASTMAAARIAELAEARRILLGEALAAAADRS